jgi:hypothetical protein
VAAVRQKALTQVKKFKATDKCISEQMNEPRAPRCSYFDRVVPQGEGPEASRITADVQTRPTRLLQTSHGEVVAYHLATQHSGRLREGDWGEERRGALRQEQADASSAGSVPVAMPKEQPDNSNRHKSSSGGAHASVRGVPPAGLRAARCSPSPLDSAHLQEGQPVATGGAMRTLGAALPWLVRGRASAAEVATGGAKLTAAQDWEEPWQQTRSQLVSMSDTPMRRNRELYQSGHRKVRALPEAPRISVWDMSFRHTSNV